MGHRMLVWPPSLLPPKLQPSVICLTWCPCSEVPAYLELLRRAAAKGVNPQVRGPTPCR